LRGSWRELWKTGARLEAFHDKSPVGCLIERAFGLAQFISLATLIWGTRAYSHSLPQEERDQYERGRSRGVDYYIFGWFLVLGVGSAVTAYQGSTVSRWLVFLGGWRTLDIVQANINMHVFDGVRIDVQQKVSSVLRSTMIAVWNYLELIGWFSLFYLKAGGLKSDGCAPIGWFDALYFSTVSQLTIGFGDLKPELPVARCLAMGQGLLGTMFVIFAIGRFASLLPSAKDETPAA